jgi:serine/threonine-protein kinase
VSVDVTFDRRYLLKRLLASSNSAQVHAGEHLFTHRPVAVKVLHHPTAQTRARLSREVEVLARVGGPGIVQMTDAGEVDGLPYIVFDLLEGRTLAGLIAARGKLGVEETIKVGVEVADALQRCHDHGVVHRDVKPSNLFVTTGARAQLTLLDFGIAKLDSDGAPQAKLTQEHALLGTPEYMAPESLLCSPDADLRVDVYGLGVTLFECLTGSVPFDGVYAEVLLKLSTTAPPSLAELRSDVPAALARVIDKSLARSPADRFGSMREMRDALRACSSAALDELDLLRDAGRARARDPAVPSTLADAPAARHAADARSRRKHPRAPYTTLARIFCADGSRVDGRLEEISEGGLQFVGDSAIPTNETVKIRFALPTSGRMAEVNATARWNRTVRGSNATGFQFAETTEAMRAEIAKYVSIMCPAD